MDVFLFFFFRESDLQSATTQTSTVIIALTRQAYQIIQNKMVRFILDLGPRTHITTKHMSDLNILKIPGRVKQLRLNITHKIYCNQAPTYYKQNLIKTVTEDSTPEAAGETLWSRMSKGQKETHSISMQ